MWLFAKYFYETVFESTVLINSNGHLHKQGSANVTEYVSTTTSTRQLPICVDGKMSEGWGPPHMGTVGSISGV